MLTLAEIVLIALGSYAFLIVFSLFGADRVIFRSRRPTYRDGTRISKVAADDGTRLSALLLRAERPRGHILFLHGNAEDLGDILARLEELQRRGYTVLAFDYRGYGTTPGQASEANVVADAWAVLRHFCSVERIPSEQVIVYGRSMGGGPGVALASSGRVGALVLDGAFSSAFRVVTRVPILPFDRFDNLSRIGAVPCPILIMHGTKDETVPFAHGQRLLQAAPAGAAHLWVKDAGHNDLIEVAGDAYWAALEALAARVPCNAPSA